MADAAPETRDLLTSGDVARLAGVSTVLVRRWDKAGKLPAERTVGGVRLFRRVDVEAFLAARIAKHVARTDAGVA